MLLRRRIGWEQKESVDSWEGDKGSSSVEHADLVKDCKRTQSDCCLSQQAMQTRLTLTNIKRKFVCLCLVGLVKANCDPWRLN